MALDLAHKPTKILAVGQSGTGKTLWTNDWLLRSQYGLYFVYDHDGQFCERHNLRGAINLADLLRQLRRGFVIFNPTEMFDDLTQGLEWYAKWAYKMSEKIRCKKLFYLDEIQDVVGLNKIGKFTRAVLVSGRNRSIDFIGASLQYNMVHNAIRGQATQTVAFFTDEENALIALTGRGFKAEQVKALPPGKFICRDKRTGAETHGKIF